jgi:hypothetical protein
MLRYIAIPYLLFCLVSCNNSVDSPIADNDTARHYKDEVLAMFNIDPTANSFPDTNSLVFFKIKVFDTTFLVHIKKEDKEISGIYYEVPPEYGSTLEGNLDSNIHYNYFQGFVFKIDQTTWNGIRRHADMFDQRDTASIEGACVDCPSYFMAYNGGKYGSSGSKPNFPMFAAYIKSTIVDKINARRRSIAAAVDSTLENQ